MPTRIIREGILTSERVNSLSQAAELFYRRLMSVADDYGRYFAHPSILRANCYPLKLDSVTESDIKSHLCECVKSKLLRIYNGGKHLELLDFKQQTRSKSKFPSPTDENQPLNDCKADVKQIPSLGVGVGVGVDENVDGNGGIVESPLRIIRKGLNEMYGRTDSAHWSYAEESTLAEVARRPDCLAEFSELKAFKSKPGSFFPRSIDRLVSDWTSVLDRSRGMVEESLSAVDKVTLNKELEEIERRIASLNTDSHVELDQEDRARLKQLKGRMAEIKNKLGRKF